MATKFNPYLNFKNNARQAMEFYQSVFGGKLTMSTFAEYHASQDPSEDNLIMHAVLEANDIYFMGSDTTNRMEYRPGTNFGMSLSGENEAELKNYFQKLSAGGMVTMPMAKAPWGDTFGMCTDKFGVNWMVDVLAPKS